MPVVSNIMFKLLGKVKLNLYIRFFCLLCASFMAANALAHDLSGWSDKTICRLIDEKHSSLLTQLLQEKITRRLICNNGRIAGYTSPTAASSEPTSDTKTSSVCSLNNLNGCINEAVCANASIKINGARKWEERPLYFKYVVEAKKRGLSCGVGSSSSTTKTTSACSSDNLNVCSNALVCGQGSRYINGKRIWDERSQHIKYSVEAKKRGLSCGVGSSSSTTKTSSVCSLNNLNGCSNNIVCQRGSRLFNGKLIWDERSPWIKYSIEAKKRGLFCGVFSVAAADLPNCSSDTNVRRHNCFGTFTFPSGEKYVGGFKNDKYDGQGTFTFPSGEKYVGGFKNDKYDGQGTLTYADGSVKDGLWKDDRFQYVNKTPIKEAVKIVANKDSSLGWIVFWLAVVGGLIFINLRASNRKQQEFLQQQKNERASKKTEDEKRHRAEQDKAEREAAAKERDRKSKESRDREALALAEKEEKTKASQEGDDESPIDKWLL